MTTEKDSINNKSTKGGAREGAGRPKGSSNKLSGQTILAAIESYGTSFADGLAQDYYAARLGDDKHLVMKYQQLILNKVVADKADVDITSAGERLQAAFSFVPSELADWSKPKSND